MKTDHVGLIFPPLGSRKWPVFPHACRTFSTTGLSAWSSSLPSLPSLRFHLGEASTSQYPCP